MTRGAVLWIVRHGVLWRCPLTLPDPPTAPWGTLVGAMLALCNHLIDEAWEAR